MAFLHLLENACDHQTFAEDEVRACRHGNDEDRNHGVCMMDRQDRIEHIDGSYVHERLDTEGIEHQVLMAEHDGLGSSRGSRCEEKGCKVIRIGIADRLHACIGQVEDVAVLMTALLEADLEAVLSVKPDSIEAVPVEEDSLDLHIVHKMLDFGIG